MVKKNIIAIIPARGGSKGIPKKNIIDFWGRPLLTWSIRQANQSKKIDVVYVSTDDKEIAFISEQYGAKIIWRPKEISGDQSPSEDALKHALNEISKKNPDKVDYVVFLQATSPLRETKNIDSAIDKIIFERADSLFSGSELGDFCIWKEKGNQLRSFNYDYKNRAMKQEFGEKYGKQFVENGSIYIFKPDILFKHNNRLGGKIVIFEMDFWKSFQIDDFNDLEFCQQLFKIKNLNKNK